MTWGTHQNAIGKSGFDAQISPSGLCCGVQASGLAADSVLKGARKALLVPRSDVLD